MVHKTEGPLCETISQLRWDVMNKSCAKEKSQDVTVIVQLLTDGFLQQIKTKSHVVGFDGS